MVDGTLFLQGILADSMNTLDAAVVLTSTVLYPTLYLPPCDPELYC